MPPAEIVAPSRTFALPLPPGEFKAYLFDCDGTVVDSMPLHYLAWRRALDAFSVDFPEELFYEWGGKPVEEILRDLSRAQGIQHSHGRIPFAIVSGGGRESVERSLAQLGLFDRFETLVCAEDYTRAKPNPEPYLLAAERLRIAPAHCLVFEDTQLGVDAAMAAGMSWVKVPHPLERQRR